jgi:hypothetical protein
MGRNSWQFVGWGEARTPTVCFFNPQMNADKNKNLVREKRESRKKILLYYCFALFAYFAFFAD